jgi:hypothetical protein
VAYLVRVLLRRRRQRRELGKGHRRGAEHLVHVLQPLPKRLGFLVPAVAAEKGGQRVLPRRRPPGHQRLQNHLQDQPVRKRLPGSEKGAGNSWQAKKREGKRRVDG